MSEKQIEIPQFSPEKYIGSTVDIVHKQSLERVSAGKKPADVTTVRDAKAILDRIRILEESEVAIRNIQNPSMFEQLPDGKTPVIGGAFDGECLKDYQEAARKLGVELKPDPWLTLRLD